jgi:hypothetical protein
VINKFVNEIVVLTPANTTESNSISCAPKPVNFKFEEKGVIKVQPAVHAVLFAHFVKNTFFLLEDTVFSAKHHKLSQYEYNHSKKLERIGLKYKFGISKPTIFFLGFH